jgi:hypothetical protein
VLVVLKEWFVFMLREETTIEHQYYDKLGHRDVWLSSQSMRLEARKKRSKADEDGARFPESLVGGMMRTIAGWMEDGWNVLSLLRPLEVIDNVPSIIGEQLDNPPNICGVGEGSDKSDGFTLEGLKGLSRWTRRSVFSMPNIPLELVISGSHDEGSRKVGSSTTNHSSSAQPGTQESTGYVAAYAETRPMSRP